MDWELYAWLKRGNRRKEILKVIATATNPLTVNEIKTKVKIAMAQASFTVKELSDKKLIDCLNPNDKIGRLFRVSKSGSELISKLQNG
jgi:predicted transcriptional regulator